MKNGEQSRFVAARVPKSINEWLDDVVDKTRDTQTGGKRVPKEDIISLALKYLQSKDIKYEEMNSAEDIERALEKVDARTSSFVSPTTTNPIQWGIRND